MERGARPSVPARSEDVVGGDKCQAYVEGAALNAPRWDGESVPPPSSRPNGMVAWLQRLQ